PRSPPRRRHRAHQRHSRRIPPRPRSGAHASRMAGARPLPRARARGCAATVWTAGGLPRLRDCVPGDPALRRYAAVPAGALPVVTAPRGRGRPRAAPRVPRRRPDRSAPGLRAHAARGAPPPARAGPGVVGLRVQPPGGARDGAARARRRDRQGARTPVRPPPHRARTHRTPGLRRVVLAQERGAGARAVDRLRRPRRRERRRRGIDGPGPAGPGRVRVGGGGDRAPPRAARVLRPRHARPAGAAPCAPPARPGSRKCASAGAAMSVLTAPRIVLEGKLNDADVARSVFYEHVLRDGLSRVETRAWATPATALDVAGAEVLFAVTGIGWRSAILRMG